MSFKLIDEDNGNERYIENRAEAEETKEELEQLGADITLEVVESDGGTTEVVDTVPKKNGRETQMDTKGDERVTGSAYDTLPENPEETENALEKLGESIENDPLDVLPGYMITTVDGKPTLNKRGVSVLAYHYDIDIVDHDTVAYPHETEYQTAVVEITVEGSDGRTFVGTGEAHVDEMGKEKLLRMAETRAYKRAVIFATGTGIVGYQEVTNQL